MIEQRNLQDTEWIKKMAAEEDKHASVTAGNMRPTWRIDDGSQWSGDPEDPPVQAYEASVYDGTGWAIEVIGSPQGTSPLDEFEMLRTIAAALNAAEESKRLALELPKHIKRACSYESEAGRHVYWPSDDGSGGYLPPHWLRAIADHLDELDAEYQLSKGESDG